MQDCRTWRRVHHTAEPASTAETIAVLWKTLAAACCSARPRGRCTRSMTRACTSRAISPTWINTCIIARSRSVRDRVDARITGAHGLQAGLHVIKIRWFLVRTKSPSLDPRGFGVGDAGLPAQYKRKFTAAWNRHLTAVYSGVFFKQTLTPGRRCGAHSLVEVRLFPQ